MADAKARVGGLLAERYELRELLGCGGVARVFAAWDRRARCSVTIKLFDVSHVPGDRFARYTATVAAAARASHPAVVLPRETACDHAPPYVVSDAVPGLPLTAVCARGGGLPWSRAVELATACADALASLHRGTGLAHRALKPSNLWLAPTGELRLLDFGIAEIAVLPAAAREGGVFGEYRAPEQIEGAAGDARSDVFTLGVLLLEMTAGIHPFAAPSAFKAAHQVCSQTAPALDQALAAARLPSALEQLLRRCMARDPQHRPADAADFAQSLKIVRQTIGANLRAPAATSAPAAVDSPEPPPERIVPDSTTVIRIPAPRSKPPVATPEPAAEAATTTFVRPRSGPPLHGAGIQQTERAPPPARPAVEAAPAAAFALPPLSERTEVLPQRSPQSPEITERLPPQPGDPIEQTLVLTQAPQPQVITDRVRKSEPESTLVLPELPARPAPTPANSPSAPSPPPPAAPLNRGALVINALLALFIVIGLIALMLP